MTLLLTSYCCDWCDNLLVAEKSENPVDAFDYYEFQLCGSISEVYNKNGYIDISLLDDD